jgi:hypothetical protein
MNDAGRMSYFLHSSRPSEDWRRADEWRRLHARPDALPLPATEPSPRFRVATILRLIPRRA